MKIRCLFLTKSREVIRKKVKPKWTHIKYYDGLYVISPQGVKNYENTGKVRGSEIIFFEGNPNPLTKKGLVDKSSSFLNRLVLENVLKQTSGKPRINIGNILSKFDALKDPSNWVIYLFIGAIAYGVLWGIINGQIF